MDWEQATLDCDPTGKISGVSFKPSISRMKRDYSRLGLSDKSRMAACFVNIKETDLKVIMADVRSSSFFVGLSFISFETLTMLA